MSELIVDKVTFGTNGSQVQPGFTGFRNKIINGNFDVWQRATSQTSNGYGSDDRWLNGNIGSTKTHSRQNFVLGQTEVPGNPQFYSRTVVTSVAGAANYVQKAQRIEYVKTLSGKTATLSFWAKADAAKNIAVHLRQGFGTGGSPSATVDGIGTQLILLSTSWAKYTITFNVPSISGKTLGSDSNDSLAVVLWFDAGSNYAIASASLGQQSGTFDIAQVQLEEGSVATAFEDRPVEVELSLCHRYFRAFQEQFFRVSHYGAAAGSIIVPFPLSVVMRVIPLITQPGTWNLGNITGVSLTAVQNDHVIVSGVVTATGWISWQNGGILATADAEL